MQRTAVTSTNLDGRGIIFAASNKGETMYLADILSRDCDNPTASDQDDFEVISLVSISDNAINRLQEDTKKDLHL